MTGGSIALVILLVICNYQIEARKTIDLEVKNGATLHVRKSHLVLFGNTSEPCKVQVVENEPMYQRVGKLTPKIFDCDFSRHPVRYQHNGSPFLSEDQVKLRVSRLLDTETIQETIYLRIRILNADCAVIKPGPRELVVSMNGISNPIRKDVVSFNHDRLFRTRCEVRVANEDFGFPEVGQLVIQKKSNPRSYEPLTLTSWDCDEFVLKEIRYQHLVPPTPDVDYIPLHAVIKDKRSRYVLKQEYHWIPVRITEAFPNQNPHGGFGNSHIMEVDQFVATNLLSKTMSASDSETKSDQIIFNITKQPECGFIVHLNDESKPIESFYQKILLSVRVSHTMAPRISWNMGLTMLEGQSRKIDKDCLQVVYHGSLDNVRMTLSGGLLHGRLFVDGHAVYSFSWNDVENRNVVYQHDDSDSLRDYIIFQVTDILRSLSTRFKMPVEILPKDDSPPSLVNNVLIEGAEGQIIDIYAFILEAFDEDSSSDFVKFNITKPPKAGMIQKRKRGDSSGWQVHQFEQQDLNQGNIIYKHSGDEVFDDSFDFVLMDSADPYPNISPEHTARIKITPVDDQPPKPADDITKSLVVNETDIAIITSDMLSYIDEENPKSPLKYAVTVDVAMLQLASDSDITDPGHIFHTDDMVMLMKSPGIPHLKMFSQDAVDHNKVAYMPPMSDVGLQPLSVYFLYSVSDIHGTKLDKERFLITVLPVDNQAPVLKLIEISVHEGGSKIVSSEDIVVTDQDTLLTDILFIVKSPPRYGQLKRFNDVLAIGDTFSYLDISDFSIQYTHNGFEDFFDSFELIASDGFQNSSAAVASIVIIPVDDEVPTFGDSDKLYVNETSSATISSQHLSATDVDTDDLDLLFYVVSHPNHGTVLLHGEPTDSFSQLDVVNGNVAYKHDGSEIGYSPTNDVISIIVEDRKFNYESKELDIGTQDQSSHSRDVTETLDLNVVIVPVNNRPPEIVIGSAVFHCDEGGKHVLTSNHIWATDLDTPAKKLYFEVSSPEFGYLEDQTPREGYEKQISVAINTFSLQKLSDGMIRYIQSKHRGIEPTVDTFTVQVTDGKHSSPEVPFLIAINPTNDEPPTVKSSNFSCDEGGMFNITESVLHVVDLDVPSNEVMISVVAPPEHGMIFDEMERISKRSRKRDAGHSHLMHELDDMTEFSMHDWSRHMVQPVYLHDGTENSRDSFQLKINDGQHTYMADMGVSVFLVNDERPSIVTNKGITVELGDVMVLSSVVLYSTDGDNSNDELIYILHSIPSHGRLQKKDVSLDDENWVDLLHADTFTEQELADNKIRYLHNDLFSSRSRDSFRFSVSDGTWATRRENFVITIQNKDRAAIHVVSHPVKVKEGDTVYITTDVLTAKDGFDRPEDISYEIVSQPVFGQLEHIIRPFEQITVFSQMDLMSRKILYRHRSKEDSLFDTFVVEAGNGIETNEAAISLEILPVDIIRPSVSLFPNVESIGGRKILNLFRGASITINDMTIAISDPDTAKDNIILTFMTLPAHGRLIVDHRTISRDEPNITLTELENDELMYENNGDANGIDRFSFTVTDDVNTGYDVDQERTEQPTFLNIQIECLDNTPPTVSLNVPTESIEMLGTRDYAVYIDSHHLMAIDDSSNNGEGIVFTVNRPPSYGVLKKKESNGRLVLASEFSISDLRTRKLMYTINSKLNVTNDSFVFDIEDDWGNVRMGHRFLMSWSRIEVAISSLILCENNTSEVSIIRYGNLRSSSFIGAKVVSMNSAEEGRDFTISNAQQIQFDPGSSQKEWFVSAIDDGIQERKEKFKMLLHSPVNAVLDLQHNDCVIVIRDSRSRKCKKNFTPIETPSASRSRTRKYGKLGKPVKVRPSTYFSNSTHRIWKYHGISPITIDEEKVEEGFDEKKSLTAIDHTLSWNAADEDLINDEPHGAKDQQKDTFRVPQQTSQRPVRMQCNRQMYDRFHYDDGTNTLLVCNGVNWVPWSPTKLKAAAPTEPPTCQDGWHYYQDKCYYVSHATAQGESWNSAQRKCREQFDAHLAAVSSKKHMNWLRHKVEKQKLWIGLNRKISDDWVWVGGESLTYANWKRNFSKIRHTHGRPTLNCAMITERKKWKAKICEMNIPNSGFVCMKHAIS